MGSNPVQTILSDEELEALDSYRRQQANPPTRGKAARELIRRALSEGKGARFGGTSASSSLAV
jgi:hypothetical protein